jgi:hypothetical protein
MPYTDFARKSIRMTDITFYSNQCGMRIDKNLDRVPT